MKTPANFTWLYVVAGIIACFCGYTDWKPGQKRQAIFVILAGIALILVGGYWWVYGGNF